MQQKEAEGYSKNGGHIKNFHSWRVPQTQGRIPHPFQASFRSISGHVPSGGFLERFGSEEFEMAGVVPQTWPGLVRSKFRRASRGLGPDPGPGLAGYGSKTKRSLLLTLRKMGAVPKTKGSWNHFLRIMETLGIERRQKNSGDIPNSINFGGTLVEPWWSLTSGPPRTTPEPIWAETPKLSAVGEKNKQRSKQTHQFEPASQAVSKESPKQVNAVIISELVD